MRVLVVDNYDSFTYNLVQYMGELGADPVVYRNDDPELEGVTSAEVDRVVISPGPGRPETAARSIDITKNLGPEVPTLGVCLGLQVIASIYGGVIERAPEPRHGKTSPITHDGDGVFTGLPNPFDATRYHSLAVVEVPDELVVTATSEDGVIQGLRHRSLPIEGVQFHPESVMTSVGMDLLANFLR